MTSVNVTTTKNTVTVNGETRVVTVKTAGPQGPAFSDGDKGDVTVSNNGTAISINNSAITSAKIADGAIVDADINASAAIALSKLATGALPTAITVTSANISDLSIVNADINASAAIAGTKISPDFGSQNIVTTGTGATGALGVTGNITVSGTVDGRDVAADGTKLDGIESGATADQTASEILTLIKTVDGAGSGLDADTLDGISSASFVRSDADDTMTGNLAIQNTQPKLELIDTDNNSDFAIKNSNGVFTVRDSTNGANRFSIASDGTTTVAQNLDVGAGLDVTGNITVTGTVDGRDVATDGTKLDGIETGATADQTAAEIKTLLDSNGIVNSNVDASAAIAGTKISPDFGSQDITTTGHIDLPDDSRIKLGTGDDLQIYHEGSTSYILDGGTGSLVLASNGAQVAIRTSGGGQIANFNVGSSCQLFHSGQQKFKTTSSGVDVTGNIAVSGTVDGVDIATRDTLFGGLTSSSGVLTNGVTATTQSASDNSTKVATTAYTDTAIANLVDSAPGTLNTLNELAAALGDDANFSTTVTNSIATKLPLAGGTLTGNLTISNTVPHIDLNDTDNENDYRIRNSNGTFQLLDLDQAGGTVFFQRETNADVTVTGNFNVTNGVDVTGNITVTGTVDGRDLATDGTKLDGIESNATADQTASEIVALVADQTIAPSIIDMEDNEEIRLGTSDDLIISHDGSNSKIADGGTGDLILFSNKLQVVNSAGSESMIIANQNAAVELYYDNSKKFHTRSNGVEVTGNAFIRADSSTDGILLIYADNGDDHDDLWRLKATDSGSNFHIDNYASSSWETTIKAVGNAQTELYYDNAKKLETTSTGVKITSNSGDISVVTDSTGSALSLINPQNLNNNDVKFGSNYGHFSVFTGGFSGSEKFAVRHDANVRIPNDNAYLQIGASQDLNLYHDGSHSYITNATGALHIHGKSGENSIVAVPDGAVNLYYDNSKKLETTSSGVKFTGVLEAIDNQSILLGTGQDFRIRHTGSHSEITDEGDGNLRLGSNTTVIANTDFSETQAKFIQNGAVELYYDNTKRLETDASGVKLSNGRFYSAGTFAFIESSDTSTTTLTLKKSASGADSIDYLQCRDSSNNIKLVISGSGDVDIEDNAKLKLGTGDDLQIYHNGIHSYITNATGFLSINTDNLTISDKENSDIFLRALHDGAVELYYDNSKKLETVTNGVYVYGQLVFGVGTSDDLFGGDNNKIILGSGSDFQFFHDGSNSYITNVTGTIHIQGKSGENSIRTIPDGAVELYYDNTVRFMTNSTGAQVTGTFSCSSHFNVGDNVQIQLGNAGANDFVLVHDGTDNIINCGNNGNLFLRAASTHLQSLTGENKIVAEADGAVELYFNGSKKAFTYADGLHIDTGVLRGDDNALIKLGNGGDLQIYHDSSTNDGFIKELGTGRLQIWTSSLHLKNQAGDEINLVTNENGNCELWFDNSKKLETTANGLYITGAAVFPDGSSNGIQIGNSSDLQLYHDGTDSFIKNTTGHLKIGDANVRIMNAACDEDMIHAKQNEQVELYYDNSKKFETTSSGVSITGTHSATKYNSINLSASVNHIQWPQDASNSNSRNFNIIGEQGQYGVLDVKYANARDENPNEKSARFVANGAVELYHDNSKKFETTSTGVTVTGILTATNAANSNSVFASTNNNTRATIELNGKDSSGNQVELRLGGFGDTTRGEIFTATNHALGFATNNAAAQMTLDTSGNLNIVNDSGKVRLGASADLQIYHDGTNSILTNSTGNLQIKSTSEVLLQSDAGETMFRGVPNNTVELRYDNVKKFETTSAGVDVTGSLSVANHITLPDQASGVGKIKMGDGVDFQIYHNGTHSVIENRTGSLLFYNNTNELAARFVPNGAVDLYYDNSKKFETTSTGVSITGNCNPAANNSHDLGTTSLRWANIYTMDLQLSNEGSTNDVDGTWGSYTIQEGVEDLFLINKRSGKKYKFNLTEVS